MASRTLDHRGGFGDRAARTQTISLHGSPGPHGNPLPRGTRRLRPARRIRLPPPRDRPNAGPLPSSIRQLASRARKHLHARRPTRHPGPVPTATAERLAEATLHGDLPTLLELLAPDVTLLTDSGGLGPAQSLTPVHGRPAVAAVFMAIAAQLSHRPIAIHYRRVAEDPCVLIFTEDSPLAAVVIDPTPAGDRIQAIYSVTNPHKLTRIH